MFTLYAVITTNNFRYSTNVWITNLSLFSTYYSKQCSLFFNLIGKLKRKPVVNSYRKWTIRKKDLKTSGQDTNGPICVKLRPDGTVESETIPCS